MEHITDDDEYSIFLVPSPSPDLKLDLGEINNDDSFNKTNKGSMVDNHPTSNNNTSDLNMFQKPNNEQTTKRQKHSHSQIKYRKNRKEMLKTLQTEVDLLRTKITTLTTTSTIELDIPTPEPIPVPRPVNITGPKRHNALALARLNHAKLMIEWLTKEKQRLLLIIMARETEKQLLRNLLDKSHNKT
jgi:hypothetical protein